MPMNLNTIATYLKDFKILLCSYSAKYESDDVINCTTNSQHEIANVCDIARHEKFCKVLRRVKLSVP